MLNTIDNLGFWGPLILIPINVVYLWNRQRYVIIYMFFLVISSMTNSGLKQLIREPRPRNQIYLNKYDISEANISNHKYGMPSGHAQATGYSITFLYLVSKSQALLMITSFIGATTLYQRYVYNRHTIGQLVIGLLIGISIAFVSLNVEQIVHIVARLKEKLNEF
jgi:membrane-associated phospholipid phosphatase